MTVVVSPRDPRIGGAGLHARGAATATTRAPLAGEATTAVRDAVDGAFAVLAVSASLARYAADTAARAARRAYARRPPARPAGVLARVLRGPAAPVVTHPVSAAALAVSAVADRLVPEVVRAVLARLDVPALVREFVRVDELAAMLDVDAVVARVDLDAAVGRVDLDAVASRLDLEAVVARLDLDRIVEKVDIGRIIDRLDLDAIVDRVDLDRAVDRVDIARILDHLDLDAIVDRVNLDRAVDRVDIARILDHLDLDAIVDRVNLDRAVDRVDVDRVISRADITGLAWYVVREIDLPGLLRASSGSVTSEMVRSVRDQGVDADRAVERIVDRLLHRSGRRTAVTDGDAGAGP